MDSPKLGEKNPRLQQGKWNKHASTEIEPGGDEESSPAQILERVKPDRVTASKPEEDRRRRTIIVEKKNGSFGFTLQSYGIHYKKEQEIEMITYVDYVDYDGAAFRAGMREGDVILSINGHDMEKADHKGLVNFIKNCETRMRMVVLFEDCVRKVELHMRYIQLQRVLQGKMAELERLCMRERDLLQGKWKTHSLPARKKATASTSTDGAAAHDIEESIEYNCRPTVSTEDVARAQQHPPTQQLLLAYQYLDPRYRAYFIQPNPGSSSGEYLWPQQHSRHESSHKVSPENQALRHSSAKGYHQTNGMAAAGPGVKPNGRPSNTKSQQTPAHHLCNPCVQASNQDSSSLDAYDLASPCCNPHCVPSARRRARQQKNKSTAKISQQEEGNKVSGWKETKPGRSTQIPNSNSHPPPPPQRGHRYFNFGTGLVSQCSLHSCTSSEMSCNNPHGSGASYTTSLSNDTLYWDVDGQPQAGSSHAACGKQGVYDQYHPHHHNQQQPQYPSTSTSQFTSYNPAKPAKSWDNLTTKAFGGYGFGYGYLDTTSAKAAAAAKGIHNRTHSTKASTNGSSQPNRSGDRRIQAVAVGALYNHNQHHNRYVQPTKSTESLLLLPKYIDPTLSDSSLSCDCLDATSPVVEGASASTHFFPVSNPNASTSENLNIANLYLVQQGRSQGSQTETKRNAQEGPEITRL